jgi:hypothetical protein
MRPLLGGGTVGRATVDSQSRSDKKRWQAQQRAAARAAFPLPDERLGRLFDHVARGLAANECDHTLRFTLEALAEIQPSSPVVQWLAEQGGYCDCEVDANARDRWEQNRLCGGEAPAS